LLCINVFPVPKGGDFRYRGATFHPGNFDIPSTVDVAIMQPLIHRPRSMPTEGALRISRGSWMPRPLVTPRQNPVSSPHDGRLTAAGLPASLRLTVDPAAVISNEINRFPLDVAERGESNRLHP
jgi:hypothetical protein